MAQTPRRIWPWLVALLLGGLTLGCSGLCLLGIGVAAVTARARQQSLATPADVIGEYDVQYAVPDDQSLTLDLARPKRGTGPFPAVVCIHGGGWRGGDKTHFRLLIHLLAQKGFVAISVRYRFAPANPFPAQIEDVKSAVRWLRDNAERFNVDPNRIGATGASAGGHLALLLGTTEESDGMEGTENAGQSSAVQAVVSVVGPTDLTAEFPPSVQHMLHDLVGGDDREALERASPIHYLSSDDPPVLLIYGTADPLVPYEQATKMRDACRETGVPVELITIDGGGHGSGGNAREWLKANQRLVEFFEQQLK